MRNTDTKKIRVFLSKTLSGFTIFNVILAQILVGLFVFTGTALASRTINSATLNGESNVFVVSAQSITAAVTVKTTGSDTDNDWLSTKYQIEGQGAVCVDTPDYTSTGTYTESFLITAPSSLGTYDVSFWAYNNNTCLSGESSISTLTDGVTVVNAITAKDAYVDANNSTTNYGTSMSLYTRASSMSNTRRVYVSFGLSSYSSHTVVSSAKVYLYLYNAPNLSRTHNIYKVTSSWTEGGITWNAQPTASGTSSSLTSTGTIDNVWKNWDVTSDVQSFLSGTTNNGWVIKDSSESSSDPSGATLSEYYSKEQTGTHDPYLELTYSCASGWTGTYCDQAVAVCGNGVLEGTETCDDHNTVSGDGCSATCQTESTFYRDADGDSYGDPANSIMAVNQPAGYVTNNTDCNDASAAVHPGATETCNGIDDNCNGVVDEGVKLTFYQDSDSDGYGNLAVTTEACLAPTGYVADNTDCDDTVASCNTDCSTLKYADTDSDLFGNPLVSHRACDAPAGYVSNNTDCNDNNSAIYPGAPETCNGVDDNCNGQIDEGEVCPLNSYYCNNDQDTYFSAMPSGTCDSYDCVPENCTTSQGTDCDDSSSAINPGATEACNRVDDNCDAHIDENWICDTTPPSAPSLSLPENNTETKTNPILSWAASTDDLSGVKDYVLKVFKGIAEGELLFQTNTTDTNYNTAGIEGGLPDDTYYWKVQANDNAGHSSEWSDKWNFIKDTAKSLLSLLTPLANSYHNGPITISGSATDLTVMTVKSVHLSYQKQGSEEYTEINNENNTDSLEPFNFSYDWTPPIIGEETNSDGSYNIQAVAEDKAGNFSDPVIVEGVVYDTIFPSTPVADPVGGDYTNNVTVSLSFEDANPDAIYYTINNSDPTSSSTKYDSETKINIGTDTTLKAIAYDKAGNASEIMTKTYNIAPEISAQNSSSPTDTSITITWTTTNHPATSRVIYGTVSIPDPVVGDTGSNYGYANSTTEDPTLVTDHSVVVSGLTAGTTYYFRTVSHGSPESVSGEISAATTGGTTSSETSNNGGGGGGGGASRTSGVNDF